MVPPLPLLYLIVGLSSRRGVSKPGERLWAADEMRVGLCLARLSSRPIAGMSPGELDDLLIGTSRYRSRVVRYRAPRPHPRSVPPRIAPFTNTHVRSDSLFVPVLYLFIWNFFHYICQHHYPSSSLVVTVGNRHVRRISLP